MKNEVAYKNESHESLDLDKNFSPLVFCESYFLSPGYCLGKK